MDHKIRWGVLSASVATLVLSAHGRQLSPTTPIPTIAAGASHSIALDADGSVWTWGLNAASQLGDGTTTTRLAPTLVTGATGTFTAVTAGGTHSLARRSDGVVVSWGLNLNGEVGDGSTTRRSSPVVLATPTGVTAVAAGGNHSLALRANGTVAAWGLNSEGQLGDNSTTRRLSAVTVSGLTGVVAIAAGGAHSLALKADGTLWSWGNNAAGQLGLGHTSQRRVPTRVTALADVVAVAAGGAHSVALKSDGSVWAWGLNAASQIGDGSTTTRLSPVRVTAMPHATAISAGGAHTLAIASSNNQVYAWGGNLAGALGDGTTTTRATPVPVSPPGAAAQIAAGGAHSLALTAAGAVWSTGANLTGQLGQGNTSSSTLFLPISGDGQAWGVVPPTVDPPGGAFVAPVTVTLSTPTPAAVIHYTTTGVDPTTDDPSVPSGGSVSVTLPGVLQTRAFRAGLAPSATVAVTFGFTAATPTIAPAGGSFSSPQTVTLQTVTPEATVTYTTDGSEPTAASTSYIAPFPVSTTQMIKAGAFRTGWADSGVASASFTFNYGTLATPVATPPGGVYSDPQSVSLSAEAGADIRFTLDGSDPTTSSSLYSTPLSIAASATVKARAFRTDWTPSPVLTETYTIETGGEPLPPDPATIAPSIDPELPADFGASMTFLFDSATPVQRGVMPGALETRRLGVVRGRTMDRAGAPLPGVRITIAGQPSWGYTLSRADGFFDIAVNAGGPLILDYQKPGFLPAQRIIDAAWHEFAAPSDVRLIPYDSLVTTVSMGPGGPHVARGSVQTDGSGTRRATLIVPDTGTRADIHLQDGSLLPAVSQLALRATEYTVGPDGPESMPADLPPTSAYTYAVELSADEAVLANARRVTFDPPLALYVENFLGFAVGTPVPAGFYDREQSAWIAADNGRVIRILGTTAGLAEIDIDGDETPNSPSELAQLGISAGERQQLASLYAPGQSLWRTPIAHFSPWDLNWPRWRIQQRRPNMPEPRAETPDEAPCEATGSIIECQNQTLGERVPLAGSGFSLNYRSDRVPGRLSARTMAIPLSGATPPAGLIRINADVQIAGQRYRQPFTPGPNQVTTFTWDGRDVYGREINGAQPARVSVSYTYEEEFAVPAASIRTFAQAGVAPSGVPGRVEVSLRQESQVSLGRPRPAGGLAGWSIDVHHRYDPESGVVYRGDGAQRNGSSVSRVVQSVIGGGLADLATAEDPLDLRIYPATVAVAADGVVYAYDHVHGIVARTPAGALIGVRPVSPTSASATVDLAPAPASGVFFAEPQVFDAGQSGFCSEGGRYSEVLLGRLALDGTEQTVTLLQLPEDVSCENGGPSLAAGRDATLYVAAGRYLYRVPRGGEPQVMRTLDEGLRFDGLAVGPDGDLYVGRFNQLERVNVDGQAEIVAGTGAFGYAGDGGQALDAELFQVRAIAIDDRGGVLFSDASGSNDFRVRRIAPDGIISTIGGGTWGLATRDGASALGPGLLVWRGLTMGADGHIYVGDLNAVVDSGRVRRLVPLFGAATDDAIRVVSEDGGEVYEFDGAGRHLRTVDTITGVTLYAFAYDSSGRLLSITDRDGLQTLVQRTGGGTPTAIVSPFGPTTTLAVDTNGYLASVTDAENQVTVLSHRADGLLTGMTDATGESYVFEYDAQGRLTRDADPAGGEQTLSRVDLAEGWVASRETGLGRTTTYRVDRLATGAQVFTNTAADGSVSTWTTAQDGAQEAVTPDGTRVTTAFTGDPRFGMAAPVAGTTTVRTPSGLTLTATTTRTVTLSDPTNVLSVTQWREDTRVNTRLYRTTYAAATRTFTTVTPANRQTRTRVDALGRVVEVQVGTLTPVLFGYDAQGRLTSRTQGTRTTTLAYDAQGYLANVTDPLLRTVSFTNDGVGRATAQTFPDARVAGFTYDGVSNLTGLTPPGQPAHTLGYTAVHDLDTYRPPAVAGTGPTTYQYNVDRQPTQLTRADGQTVGFTYDGAGRLETLVTPTGTTSYGHEPGTGRLGGIAAPGATLTYAYDGALLTGEAWSGLVTGDVTWTYDNFFRVNTERVRGAHLANFGYDLDGLLTSAGAAVFTRQAATGLLATGTVGSVATSFGYNTFGELTSHTTTAGGALYSATLTRDAGGRIEQQAATLQGVTTTEVYGYDPAGRLASVTRNGVPYQSYGYDANGNRTSLTTSAVTIAATYDAQDRLLTWGTRTYTYTPHGDLASWTDTATSQTAQYSYDVQGNLRQVTQPDGTLVSYAVDGRNRRIARAVNGAVVQQFLWQGQLRPVAELDGAGTLVSRFVYGTRINVPEYMVRGGVTYRLLTDHLGSVRLVVNTSTNAVAQRIDYDPWGVVTLDTNPGFQPFGYAGGLYDPVTGLVRFGVRDYDAVTGRWTAKDPIGFLGGDTNLLSYVASDPVNLVDPTGRDWLSANANFWAGFGDSLTSGFGLTEMLGVPSLTELVRIALGVNVVSICSSAYSAGGWASVLWSLAAGPAGGLNGGARSVFYSGYDAGAFHASSGLGIRITDTLIGRLLNSLGVKSQSAWDAASAVFAMNAKGTATAVVRGPVNPASTWARVEHWILDLRQVPIVYR
jgi:RHS repeat-associated protein